MTDAEELQIRTKRIREDIAYLENQIAESKRIIDFSKYRLIILRNYLKIATRGL